MIVPITCGLISYSAQLSSCDQAWSTAFPIQWPVLRGWERLQLKVASKKHPSDWHDTSLTMCNMLSYLMWKLTYLHDILLSMRQLHSLLSAQRLRPRLRLLSLRRREPELCAACAHWPASKSKAWTISSMPSRRVLASSFQGLGGRLYIA